MIKMQVVSSQINVSSLSIFRQLIAQHFKLLDIYNKYTDDLLFFFFNTVQFNYIPRILDLQKSIVAITYFSYLKLICVI